MSSDSFGGYTGAKPAGERPPAREPDSLPPRTCATCLCFARSVIGSDGECRRGAPARSKIDGNPLAGRWPKVLVNDWCWEHRRKREVAP